MKNQTPVYLKITVLVLITVSIVVSCSKSSVNDLTPAEETSYTIYPRADDVAWDSIGKVYKKYNILLLAANYSDTSIWYDNNTFVTALGITLSEFAYDIRILKRNAPIVLSYVADSLEECDYCGVSMHKKVATAIAHLDAFTANPAALDTFNACLKKNEFIQARQNSSGGGTSGVNSGGCSLGYYMCSGLCISTIEIPIACIACIYLCGCQFCSSTPGCDNL